jgi:predicted secreted Zn-dependent protease
MDGGVCRMEKVSVLVGVTTIRPRWRNEKDGAAALQERWKKMIAAIDQNEAFHKQQATDAGKEIDAALANLEPTDTCEQLTVAANTTASRILEKHKKASYDYDKSIDYGRKNGVSLI